jgi:glyoxylase-like metal-dependent hydrolase (beta-lactamase superfamily II)
MEMIGIKEELIDLRNINEKLSGIILLKSIGICSNVYIIGKKILTLIDCGDGSTLDIFREKLKLINIDFSKIKQVIITHKHFDHVYGLDLILKESNPKIFIHKEDCKNLINKYGKYIEEIEDGDIIVTSIFCLKVVHTPGHTNGSICLYEEDRKILFSGDTIFANGYYGKVNDIESFNKIINSIKKLSNLKIDFLLPGHGELVIKNTQKYINSMYKKII